jgi:hypothetical protein
MRLLRGSFWHPVQRTQAGVIHRAFLMRTPGAMMLIGFAGLGCAGYWASRKSIVPPQKGDVIDEREGPPSELCATAASFCSWRDYRFQRKAAF